MRTIIITESQYDKLLKRTITEGVKKPNVLFVGDSQTVYSNSYANQLLNSGLVDGKILAQEGKGTGWMLDALQTELKRNKYDIISIMGGGNDGGSKTPDRAIRNLTKMYKLAKSSGAKVVALSNPTKTFTNKSDNRGYRNKKYPSNEGIGDWVESQGNSDYTIDVQSTTNSPQYFKDDMVHLNANAHDKIKNMWYGIVLKGDSDEVVKDLDIKVGGEGEENIEQGLEYFGQEGRDAQEFLDSIESLLDQGEDVLIEKQVEGGYSFDDRVLDLQTALVLLGYELPKYGIDGLFGPETETSVREFQTDHELTDDGIIDYETIENILVDLSEYSDEEINDFLGTELGRQLNKSYDFMSDSEKVAANKLLSDLDSELGNTNLSKALVANAVGESALNVDARGDAGEYATQSERNQRRNVGGFCSFGLWQYNICGGLGVELLKYYGVDPDNSSSDQKMEVLGDYDKQVSFMVNHVKRKGVVSQEKSVRDWVKWIVYEIERPKDKEGAVAKRVKHAASLGYLS